MKNNPWKEYFRFSRREQTGIIILIILVIGVLLLRIHSNSPATHPPADDTAFLIAARSLDTLTSRSTPSYRTYHQAPAANTYALFRFDPNTLPENEWLRLGVSPRTARTIQNYLAKGGHFRQPADLRKIYGLPTPVCDRLIPYVHIAGSTTPHPRDTPSYTRYTPHYTPRKVIAIDINNADSAAWEQLPGIGPVLAARIIKFRDALGGFHRLEQVAETYGLPDSTFYKIQPSLLLDKVSLKKIDLNHTDEKSLSQHPYIRKKLAMLISRYRNEHGPFHDITELYHLPLVDEEVYKKLMPYIDIK
ncbi:helix-hairpin-helix domain-containing protein [Chitinophaga pendula]|uniref:ComEA family DNA-binding protein n=1 Tax=Chitinophaga TaxID=79328 RepID=UPI000BB004DB|nr:MULTISPECIES: helix-hairpin-helix domain-containing protein [Chitinophaga]ASZ10905.1 DNA-binding protein [Chitinophaga sp. MD30]UCJ06109.1 helix-hairpin-helix domain-containing protein [Chitinophaga pendula]